ncbi:unnamed protein product, partial [Mesorhabditis spiculigera]
MDVYESADGTGFQLQSGSRRTGRRLGSVRDPGIFRNTDGLYYLTYTTGGGANIGFARSSDRINWTPLGNYPVPVFACALMPGTGDGTGSASLPGFRVRLVSSDGPSLSPFVTKAWGA